MPREAEEPSHDDMDISMKAVEEMLIGEPLNSWVGGGGWVGGGKERVLNSEKQLEVLYS